MTAGDLAGPAFLRGSVGADFQIVGPPELSAYVREWGAPVHPYVFVLALLTPPVAFLPSGPGRFGVVGMSGVG